MDFPFNKDITYFAKTNFRGADQIFGIKRKDRRQHVYLLGKSGSGKSVVLENMIIQNINQGEGVCVVDPHGELVEKILETIPRERAQDVVYFNPADTENNIGFNVLQLDDPRYKHLVASGLMGIFTKIWANAWSSRMEYILNNTILALLDTPDTTLLGIPRMLVDKDYRQYIINNLKDPVVKAFWVHEYEAWRDQFRNEAIAPIQNKVGQFLSSNIVRNVVGQTRSTINIFEIMNNKKIFLVNVSKGRIGEDNSALLGGMLITKLQLSAMERVRIPENQREDFYLYVDEFQNFVTDSFASILSEARKYRLNLTIAHQYIAQLETADSKTVKDAVFGNVGTMIIFRVGAEDAEALEKEFEPEFLIEDFVNLPNYHIYTKLMVDGVTSRPFSAKTLPPVAVDSSEETRDYIIESSRKNYTRPRKDVEEEIHKWSSTVPGTVRPDGEETEGKFKAECSNCKKSIYVPFEPEPGRPVYCKECLFKIKNGELEPTVGFRAPKEKKEAAISYDALAGLGIEFKQSSAPPVKYIAQQERFKDMTFRPSETDQVKAYVPPRAAPASSTPIKETYGTRPRVDIPSIRPASNNTPSNVPPSGMQKIPIKETYGTRPRVDTPKDAPMNVPPPRTVKMPIRKERTAPDTSGLRGMLQSALGNVTGNQAIQPAKQNIPSEPIVRPSAPQPTMSLSSLKKNPQTTQQYAMPPKEASIERQNMLKDAISRATGVQNAVSEPTSEPAAETGSIIEPQAPITEISEPASVVEETPIVDEQIELERKAREEAERNALEDQRRKDEEAQKQKDLEQQKEKERQEELEKQAREAQIAREAKEAEELAQKKILEEQERKQEVERQERELELAKEKEAKEAEERTQRIIKEREEKEEAERQENARQEALRQAQEDSDREAQRQKELEEQKLSEEKSENERREKEQAEKDVKELAPEKENAEDDEKEAPEAKEEAPQPETPSSGKKEKTKEVPEDLLKRILE